MIDLNIQADSRGLKSTGVNALFRFSMQNAKPLEVKKGDDYSFAELKELENRPWITTLKIQGDAGEFEFSEIIITLSQERNIVTTSLQGRDGTIKEYISDGDYAITLDAAILPTNAVPQDEESTFAIAENRYPDEELKKLHRLLLEKKALEVQSDFLTLFDINSAVVKSYSLQQETHSNRQSLQIQMLSDRAYEIKQIQQDDVKVK
ncbi:DUF6046 domain-containing protein [Ornithobacterium rhinotracheale]|uniref:DUF6046 domain-containing protein n=1 Tax=Ornithobacterium rhinotracheale TaxID=28251 RepID=UPI001FF55388|nr:DUF6046 domain-containing protein [Ornithobacterium rhinotracheale]MCK0206220.1 DUF6046 domain-containing protein [Ornithobacterium rhinotracheale]